MTSSIRSNDDTLIDDDDEETDRRVDMGLNASADRATRAAAARSLILLFINYIPLFIMRRDCHDPLSDGA